MVDEYVSVINIISSHLNEIIFHYKPEGLYFQKKKFEKIFSSFFKAFSKKKTVIWWTLYNTKENACQRLFIVLHVTN